MQDVVPNNVARCCVQMVPVFDQAFKYVKTLLGGKTFLFVLGHLVLCCFNMFSRVGYDLDFVKQLLKHRKTCVLFS